MRNWMTALLVAAAPVADAQTPHIAVVDFAQISQDYGKSKARFDALKAEETQIKAELAKEFEGYKAIIEQAKQLEKQYNDAASNPQFREAKQTEAKALMAKAESEARRLQGIKKERETAYQKHYAEATEEVLRDIQAVASDFAREKGIDLLFDKSCKSRNAAPLVQHADDRLDVTAELLARLNQKAAAAAPRATP